MLEPIRAIRLIGSLVLSIGAIFLIFWKIFSIAIAVGMSRYASFTGKLAKSLFNQDRALLEFLKTGELLIPWLLFIGIAVSCVGIFIIAFPKQALQILCAFRILKLAKVSND